MGGLGSGRQGGLGADKCHEFQSIDLAWLRRKGLLVPGRRSSINWSRAGQATGAITIAVEAHGVRLVYWHRPTEGEARVVNELVPLVRSETNFGGRRSWFRCLSCHRRCRILYGGAHFRCRRCHRLKYETQYEPAFARAAGKVHKLRAHLGGSGSIDDPFPPKPKGMHWTTYQQLEAEDERLQELWAAGTMEWMRRLV